MMLAGLAKLLADEYELAGTAVDGRALIAAAQKLQPDIVIADISMPRMNGIEAIRRIKEMLPATKFLVLSVHTDTAYVEEAFRAGARGYVLKQSAPDELFVALRAVVDGRVYVTPKVQYTPNRSWKRDRLTLRQLEVLRLVAEGLQNKEIADRLSVTVKTVEYHKTSLMQRLNIHTATGLTAYAIHAGIAAP